MTKLGDYKGLISCVSGVIWLLTIVVVKNICYLHILTFTLHLDGIFLWHRYGFCGKLNFYLYMEGVWLLLLVFVAYDVLFLPSYFLIIVHWTQCLHDHSPMSCWKLEELGDYHFSLRSILIATIAIDKSYATSIVLLQVEDYFLLNCWHYAYVTRWLLVFMDPWLVAIIVWGLCCWLHK